jgi:two-component system OmpR family sensor kinase
VPLRWKLAVVFAAGTAALMAVAGLFLLNQVQRILDASAHELLISREEVLARLVLIRGDELGGRPVTSDFLDWPYPPQSEQTAQLFTPDDDLVLSFQVPDAEPLLDEAQLARARRGALEFRAPDGSAGEAHLLRATPAPDRHGRVWVVVVGADLTGADALVQRIWTGLLLAGPLVIALSAVGAWMLAGASLRPVERLRRQAAALSADDTGASLHVPATGDEIAALGATMNEMLQRLQRALSRQRQLVADAGHELRTPLTVLRAELELANRSGRSREQLRESVAFATVEVERLVRLAEHLLLLARADEGRPLLDPSVISLRDVLATAVRAVSARAAPEVRVVLDAPEDTALFADPERIRQAVDALLDNALRFAPPGTQVTVSLRRDPGPRGEQAVIQVADRGPGFPPELLARAFERFERGDAARTRDAGGSGLGLAIARSLVQAHGGDAVASNDPQGGAVVRLELPLSGNAAVVVPT